MTEIEALQATEAEALARFRKRATELRTAHPDWSPRFCFSKAIEGLPATTQKYLYTIERLKAAGVAALPLR
jgi:hypothetical protein